MQIVWSCVPFLEGEEGRGPEWERAKWGGRSVSEEAEWEVVLWEETAPNTKASLHSLIPAFPAPGPVLASPYCQPSTTSCRRITNSS